MGPIRSGQGVAIGSRTVAAADTAHPNATNPAAADVIRPGVVARSRDIWVRVSNAAADAGVSVTVTLFTSVDGTGTQATAGTWATIDQLNSGAPIVPATGSALTHTNRIAYRQAVPGLVGARYIFAAVTGTFAQAITVTIEGEDQ